jgi:predicted Zn-dependent protease with MMP-like domain
METERFSQLVDEAVASIPEYFRSRFANISIDIMPLATMEIARTVTKHPWSLLGIYQGIPYGHRGPWYGNVMPDRILIFQKPIERLCRTDADVRALVRRVVIHEVGHYFGLSDDELYRLERECEECDRKGTSPAAPS